MAKKKGVKAPKKKAASPEKPAAPKKAAKRAKKAAKAPKRAAKKAEAPTAVPKPSARPVRTAKLTTPERDITLQVYDVQEVPDEHHFYFVNGERVKNVKELAEVMDRIEQEVFDHHVSPDRNDFHNWVRHVFDDVELAEKLLGVTGPKHLQFTIYKHVADKALKR